MSNNHRFNVGIYAPYTKQDTTAIALRFCKAFISSNSSVSPVYGYYGPRLDVEPDSDYRLNYAPLEAFFNFAEVCKHIVWFDIQKNKLKAARKMGVKNTLYFVWNRYTTEQLSLLNLFHRVVFPYHKPKIAMEQEYLKSEGWVLPPYPEVPPTNKIDSALSESLRYFVPVSGSVSEVYGEFLVRIARMILQADQFSKVTLSPTKATFPKRVQQKFIDLEIKYRGRFSIINRRGYAEYSMLMLKHDWLIWPSWNDCTGLAILEANACQLPVVAFDIPPATELIDSGLNGYLVECNVGVLDTSQPFVVSSEEAFLRKLEEISGDYQLLVSMRSQLHEARVLADENYSSLCLNSLLVP